MEFNDRVFAYVSACVNERAVVIEWTSQQLNGGMTTAQRTQTVFDGVLLKKLATRLFVANGNDLNENDSRAAPAAAPTPLRYAHYLFSSSRLLSPLPRFALCGRP